MRHRRPLIGLPEGVCGGEHGGIILPWGSPGRVEVGAGVIRQRQLLDDGDMEDTGTGSWAAYLATLSKETLDPAEAVQYLRVARSDATYSGYAYQTAVTPGRRHRLTGWGRSDGTSQPKIYAGVWAWSGTLDTSWQQIDVIFTPTLSVVRLYATLGGVGNYTEFDGLYLCEV